MLISTPEHVRRRILSHLDNDDWFQCQLAHSIFHVSTEEEIQTRKENDINPITFEIWKTIEDAEDWDTSDEETYRINIREFKPRRMRKNPNILIIGRTHSGKTTLMKDLIRKQRLQRNGSVICPTNEFTMDWDKSIVDQQYVYNDCSSFREILERHRRKQDKKSFVAIDDCLIKSKDRSYYSLLDYNKLFGISCLISERRLHDANLTDYVIKSSIDYIFFAKEPDESKATQLFRKYGSLSALQIFEFTQILQSLPAHTFLVIDNKSTSDNIDDNVFWYSTRTNQAVYH